MHSGLLSYVLGAESFYRLWYMVSTGPPFVRRYLATYCLLSILLHPRYAFHKPREIYLSTLADFPLAHATNLQQNTQRVAKQGSETGRPHPLRAVTRYSGEQQVGRIEHTLRSRVHYLTNQTKIPMTVLLEGSKERSAIWFDLHYQVLKLIYPCSQHSKHGCDMRCGRARGMGSAPP